MELNWPRKKNENFYRFSQENFPRRFFSLQGEEKLQLSSCCSGRVCSSFCQYKSNYIHPPTHGRDEIGGCCARLRLGKAREKWFLKWSEVKWREKVFQDFFLFLCFWWEEKLLENSQQFHRFNAIITDSSAGWSSDTDEIKVKIYLFCAWIFPWS